MKLFNKYSLVTDAEYDEALKLAQESGKKLNESKAEKLKEELDKLKAEMKTLNRAMQTAKEEIKVYKEERDDVKEVFKQSLLNEDKEAILAARKESLDQQAATQNERENLLASAEESNYKKGYADGLADGLRKIHEITAKDREDAMKIAMVAASSHTPVDNLKEINSVHQLTAGSQNK